MIREQLFALHHKTTQTAFDLLKAKNHDYCKTDAFTNLTLCESMGICSAEEGVIIRMTDKLSRLSSVLSKGAKLKTESVEDTIVDIINYAVLLRALSLRKETKDNEELPKREPRFYESEASFKEGYIARENNR